MSSNGNGQTEEAAASEDNQQPHFNMIAQYIKDLSFENPNAPMSLQDNGGNPNIEVSVNVSAQKLDEQVFEVVLQIGVSSTSNEQSVYEIELAYAGLFRLINIPEEALQPILLIQCPNLIFPFVRRLLVDLTREGGYPPLMIDPINFEELFRHNMQQSAAEAMSEDSDVSTGDDG